MSAIPAGYKQTEVGVIPKEWNTASLDSCLDLLTDFEANGSFESVAANVQVVDSENFAWYVRATDLENGSRPENVRYVTERSYKFLKKTALHGGEVLITKRGEIGKVYLFEMQTAFATVAPNLYLLKLNAAVLPKYAFAFFRYGNGNQTLKNINASTTLGALYKNDVKAILLPLPPLPEQRAIAAALSDVDALLAKLDQFIAKKRDLKQAAMQQLLTGQTRLPGFSGEWEVKRLGDVAHIKTGSRNNEDKIEDGEYPFFVRSENVERINSYSHDCEAILVPGEGRIGDIFHYIKGRFDVHQRVYAITQFGSDVSGKFVHLYMVMNFGSHAMQNSVKATVDSLRLPTFQEFQLKIPPTLGEQTAIATVLSDMDAELAALEARRDKTRALKQGMMHELLTGRIRLV
jgi:type I restriction enzyme S subunit